MENITNYKGDIGVACVMADLTKHGISVALPIASHLPFDIIAINNCGKLSRLSVKFMTKRKNGTLHVPLKTMSYNSSGPNSKSIDWNKVDAFAIYCIDNNKCYYVDSSYLINLKSEFVIRIDPPKKMSNSKIINWSTSFENIDILFSKLNGVPYQSQTDS